MQDNRFKPFQDIIPRETLLKVVSVIKGERTGEKLSVWAYWRCYIIDRQLVGGYIVIVT